MDTQRLILLFIFSFSLLMLWEAWDKQGRPKPAAPAPSAQQAPGVPAPAKPQAQGEAKAPAPSTAVAGAEAVKGEIVRVTTDLLVADVDTLGGTLKRIELPRHKGSKDPNANFVLLGPEHQYEAQSGLAGEGGPNHRSLWRAVPGERTLPAGQDSVELRLSAAGKDGLEVQKVYT
ncbi:MAG: membrane protein insertase YidC, partial [Burkholderiales bacterium]